VLADEGAGIAQPGAGAEVVGPVGGQLLVVR